MVQQHDRAHQDGAHQDRAHQDGAHQDRAHQDGAHQDGAPPARRHILVIEDEPNIAAAMQFLLQRDGWAVSLHGGGADAMAAVRREAPDLLVLDVMLPGPSGFDILAALRADPATRDLPVLMLTARGQERDRAAALRAGADGYMTKPFANADLLAAVRDLARERSA